MAYEIAVSRPGGIENLVRRDVEIPTPDRGDVLVRQTAIGINFIDIYMRTGLYPWPVDNNFVPGCEAAGVIEEVGESVDDVKVGDRVAYSLPNGCYATHRVVPAAQAVRLPDFIPDEIAAGGILKGLTAHYLMHDSFHVIKNQTVLFHAAAGGVGLIAGQWLRVKGVRSIGTAGGPQKCALAKENGYDETIDYRNDDFVDAVMALTDGQGTDVVYDSVGKDTLKGSLACLKTFGTLVSFGQSSGTPEDFKISDLARGSLRLTRPTLFHYSASRDWLQNAATDLFDIIGAGHVSIRIGQTLPLTDAAEAHRALEARETTGSTILIPT